jgi:hypothetical protein
MPETEESLRKRARQLILEGRLPGHGPDNSWGGAGSNETCPVCEIPVYQRDVEMELEFSAAGGTGKDIFHLHRSCYAAWELERHLLNGSAEPQRRSGVWRETRRPPAQDDAHDPAGVVGST